MPKVSGSGKRGEYKALEIMKKGVAVTPTEINDYTGAPYASKYMSFLKRDGHVVQVNKDGREVVSYTLISSPDVSKWPKGAFEKPAKVETKIAAAKKSAVKPKAKAAAKPKAKAKPAAKPKSAAKVKVKAVEPDKFALPAKKAVNAKVAAKKAPKPVEDIGEVGGGSFSVESGWDELDPRELA